MWHNGWLYCCFPVSLTVFGPGASKHPFSAACFFCNFSSSIPNALTVCALCALYFLLILERMDFPIVSVGTSPRWQRSYPHTPAILFYGQLFSGCFGMQACFCLSCRGSSRRIIYASASARVLFSSVITASFLHVRAGKLRRVRSSTVAACLRVKKLVFQLPSLPQGGVRAGPPPSVGRILPRHGPPRCDASSHHASSLFHRHDVLSLTLLRFCAATSCATSSSLPRNAHLPIVSFRLPNASRSKGKLDREGSPFKGRQNRWRREGTLRLALPAAHPHQCPPFGGTTEIECPPLYVKRRVNHEARWTWLVAAERSTSAARKHVACGRQRKTKAIEDAEAQVRRRRKTGGRKKGRAGGAKRKEEGGTMLQCNLCWKEIQHKGAGLPACNHVFCIGCANEILRSDNSRCPQCDNHVSKSDFKPVRIYEENNADASTLLWGFEPSQALELVAGAVARYTEQKQIEMEASLRGIHEQYQQRECVYVQKLEELKAALIKAKKKIQDLSTDKKNLERDKHELQKKYAEKSAQKRKLGDALNELQQQLAGGPPAAVVRTAPSPMDPLASTPVPRRNSGNLGSAPYVRGRPYPFPQGDRYFSGQPWPGAPALPSSPAPPIKSVHSNSCHPSPRLKQLLQKTGSLF